MYSVFKNDIWGAELVDTKLIVTFNKGFRFLLCVIDIFSKYAWVVPLRDKKGVSIANAFQSILKKSNKYPNKIWVDKGSEFYKNCFKNGYKTMILLCIIQHIMEENLLFLKDLLEPERTKFTNT